MDTNEPQKVSIVVANNAALGRPDEVAEGHFIVSRGVVMLSDSRGKPFADPKYRALLGRKGNAEEVAKKPLAKRAGQTERQLRRPASVSPRSREDDGAGLRQARAAGAYWCWPPP